MKKIAFLTTQTASGSTVIGRVLPLAEKLATQSEIHVLFHEGGGSIPTPFHAHMTGREPFIRTANGKKALTSIHLIARMKWNAIRAAFALYTIRPDIIVIVKSLPENVLAAWLAKLFFLIPSTTTIILDVDDFELTANRLSSVMQRIAIHWANRAGARIAHHIFAATPFLQDYFRQLVPHKDVLFLPTGTDALPHTQPNAQPPTIVYAGSISIASGHRVDLLPEILANVRKEVPNVHLIMAGGGDDISALKDSFSSRGLADAVTWIGRYHPATFDTILSKAHVLIDPVDTSVTNRAKSSFRVATAIANGVPIVTSNVGIRTWLVPDTLANRFFATPGDASDYAAKIVWNLTHPLTRDESTRMQSHALRYNWDTLSAIFSRSIT